MKKILLFLLAFATLAASATNRNRNGSVQYHNNVAYLIWSFNTSTTGSYGVAGLGQVTDDTLTFMADTNAAVLRAFSTPALRVKSALQADKYDAIPDSLSYCIEAKDDAADAVTLKSYFRYKFGTTYIEMPVASNALAGAGAKQLFCNKVIYIPDTPFLIKAAPSTSTDSSYIYTVKVWANFK